MDDDGVEMQSDAGKGKGSVSAKRGAEASGTGRISPSRQEDFKAPLNLARRMITLLDRIDPCLQGNVRKLVYWISLDKLESIDRMHRQGDDLVLSGSFRLSLRLTSTPAGEETLLKEKWLVDVLPLLLLKNSGIREKLMRELWAFRFSAVSIMENLGIDEKDLSLPRGSQWRELLQLICSLLEHVNSHPESEVFREVEMGRAQVEIWKGLTEYYEPIIQDLLLQSASQEGMNINIHMMNLERFLMHDALGKVRFQEGGGDSFLDSEFSFDDLLVPVEMHFSIRTLGKAPLVDHVGRILGLGDATLKMKALMGLVLNYNEHLVSRIH